jgi:hypothetical protein
MRKEAQRMLATLRRLGAVTAVAATALLGTAAAAQAAMNITLGQPELTSKVLITLPVTVNCSPFDSTLVLFQSQLLVRVEQASGRQIARGEGGAFDAVPACDNTAYTIDVPILADPAGPPFHGGTAVFSVSASVAAGTPCPPEWGSGCFMSPFDSRFANLITPLKMH